MTRRRERLLGLAATCGGLGYVPGAPGTAGALAGVVMIAGIRLGAPASSPWLIGMALLLVCVATIALGPWAERHWGKKDPKPFVLDEMAGYFMAVLFLPEVPLWLRASAGFFVARAMDVIKPFPARQLEALPAGWGVLLDDIFASIYANVILQFGLRWWLARNAG